MKIIVVDCECPRSQNRDFPEIENCGVDIISRPAQALVTLKVQKETLEVCGFGWIKEEEQPRNKEFWFMIKWLHLPVNISFSRIRKDHMRW